jgi:hypothetical protein
VPVRGGEGGVDRRRQARSDRPLTHPIGVLVDQRRPVLAPGLSESRLHDRRPFMARQEWLANVRSSGNADGLSERSPHISTSPDLSRNAQPARPATADLDQWPSHSRALRSHRVDRKARVSVRSAYKSVPARYVRRRLDVRVGVERIDVLDGATVVASHPGCLKGDEVLSPDPYLEVLAYKPGALPGATALARTTGALRLS